MEVTVSVLEHVVENGIDIVEPEVEMVDTWRPELWRSAFIEHPLELAESNGYNHSQPPDGSE